MMKIQLPIATGSLVPPVRKQSCQVINAVIAPFTLGEKLTSRRTRTFQMVKGPHGFYNGVKPICLVEESHLKSTLRRILPANDMDVDDVAR